MTSGWVRLIVLAIVAAAGWGLTARHLARPSAAPAPAAAQPAPRPAMRAAAPKAPAPVATPAPVPSAYVVRRVLDVPEPMHHGDWFWDEDGAPATGEIVITVDTAAQVLSVFRDGYEIGTAVILYGADAKPTPLGVYPVTQKDADHHSNLYDGAPMPYMLRLTNDGVSIHGSKVEDGYMTHGCIGVPTPFAKKLFGVTRIGTKVIVTRGERLATGQAIKAA